MDFLKFYISAQIIVLLVFLILCKVGGYDDYDE